MNSLNIFLVSDAPWMLLVSDIRTGLVYFLLFGFWVVFISEHLLERPNRNKMVSQWKVISCRLNILLVKLQDRNVSYNYLYLLYVHLWLCGTRYPNSIPLLVHSWFYSRSTVSSVKIAVKSLTFSIQISHGYANSWCCYWSTLFSLFTFLGSESFN